MLGALSVAVPLVLAAVLFASAIAKLREPDDLAGWAELGVPASLRREWLRVLHPWGELALGLALVVFGGVLGLLAALIAVALMVAYLVLVWRVFARGDGAACACFGSRTPITRVTVWRNAWLVLVAVTTASVIWRNPLLGGVFAVATATDWAWIAIAAAAAVTAVLVVWSSALAEPEAAASTVVGAPSSSDDLDYVRTRTPAVPVTLADGRTAILRDLARERPMLLLAVSQTCGACQSVIERVPEWRALLPEVDVRLLLMHAPKQGGLTEFTEPQSLHDPHDYVRGSIAEWATPTAVLFGVDGLLAGGPAAGPRAITALVEDMHDSLRALRGV